jgi:hypothetical protein
MSPHLFDRVMLMADVAAPLKNDRSIVRSEWYIKSLWSDVAVLTSTHQTNNMRRPGKPAEKLYQK